MIERLKKQVELDLCDVITTECSECLAESLQMKW